MKKDSLGDRMKEYENVNRNYLTKRMPVIIRIDGRAFHTFTKKLKKPFDDILMESMQNTMKYLCENIPGCELGYTQSDEISLLLIDYYSLETSAWFDNNIQKLASVSASMATMFFNKEFYRKASKQMYGYFPTREDEEYAKALLKACNTGATFDSRVFNLPKEEVTNYFLWRQNDATRNSIEMVAHQYFSTKELHKKNCSQIQEMLYTEHNFFWNGLPGTKKRGSCCVKREVPAHERRVWTIDNEIPVFKEDGRDYIESIVFASAKGVAKDD